MTESTHDGWPDEYRDPRDRPHPDVLRVTVETFDQMRDDTLETTTAIAEGEQQSAVVSFATVGEFRKILTNRRLELLKVLMDTDGAAASIRALADDLERDYRVVHNDVALLDKYGLLFTVEDGRAKRPFVPYRRIHLDIELVADAPPRIG